ncbi:MAG: hypothetical protein V7782_14905 [Psychromonas sp.]
MITKLKSAGKALIKAFVEAQQFHKRIWVVSIQSGLNQQGSILNDTYLVSEDDFETPMQWMHKKGYTTDLIDKIDSMKLSQVFTLKVNGIEHSLMRVK